MDISHIIWSAQACPFRKAGVYFGVSPGPTHELVARWLLPRRGAVYPGGSLCVRPDLPAPLTLFTVRDPSAVRVKPVKSSGPRNGPRNGHRHREGELSHVALVFPLDQRTPLPAPAPAHPPDTPVGNTAPFVVTIGLKIERETEFHERVILANPDLPYALLCERIMELRDEFSN